MVTRPALFRDRAEMQTVFSSAHLLRQSHMQQSCTVCTTGQRTIQFGTTQENPNPQTPNSERRCKPTPRKATTTIWEFGSARARISQSTTAARSPKAMTERGHTLRLSKSLRLVQNENGLRKHRARLRSRGLNRPSSSYLARLKSTDARGCQSAPKSSTQANTRSRGHAGDVLFHGEPLYAQNLGESLLKRGPESSNHGGRLGLGVRSLLQQKGHLRKAIARA